MDEITRILVDHFANEAKKRIAEGGEELLDLVLSHIHSSDPERAGALSVLAKICDDLEGSNE